MRLNHAFGPGRLALFGLLCLLAACGQKAKEPGPPETAAPPVKPETAAAADVPLITTFGVPECDDYVEKYMSCLEGKVSPEAKQRLLETFEMNRNKWRAMAAMKESASALAVVCRAATQKAKEELSVDYGCEF
jgi:hypothetical protein